MLEQRTIEILAQVVYKELQQTRVTDNFVGEGKILDDLVEKENKNFWEYHKEQTLELARNIIRVNKTINPTKK
jgi:hypothetical protein|tara:strand:- start:4678 stop:4896 length:219 start_codon:yes stop_codon:yes gene_type:complete